MSYEGRGVDEPARRAPETGGSTAAPAPEAGPAAPVVPVGGPTGRAGITRRSLVRGGAAAGLALTLPQWAFPRRAPAAEVLPFTQRLRMPPVLTGAELTVPIVEAEVALAPGTPTRMWTFGGTFPGPTIRRPTGTTTTVTFDHRLPAAGTVTIHHHGHHTPAVDDGQPMSELLAPGAARTYTYEHVEDGRPQRGAMRWYHDHSHGRTGLHSWHGLLGLFVVDGPDEQARGLPGPERELLLVISETRLDEATNQLTDPFSSASNPGADDVGTGDRVLVNGVQQPFVEVSPTRYRLRILNAAHFRPYNLSFGDGTKLLQVGTESGLLPAPIERDSVLLGPAERCDLVVDFSALAGRDVVLSSARQAARPGAWRALPAAAAASDDVMQFRVRGEVVPSAAPSAALVPLPEWTSALPQEPDRILAFGQGVDPSAPSSNLIWTINGRPYDPEAVVARPELGSIETWLLVNVSSQSHYIHLHDVDWKVVLRNGAAPAPEEDAMKETFRLDPGDVLLVGTKFTDHLGQYMVHCHMLSHEDHAMMAPFVVVPAGEGDRPADPLDALTSAEAVRVSRMLAEQRARPGRPAAVPAAPLTLGRDAFALCDLTREGGGATA